MLKEYMQIGDLQSSATLNMAVDELPKIKKTEMVMLCWWRGGGLAWYNDDWKMAAKNKIRA